MAPTAPTKVQDPSKEVLAMRRNWALTEALMGGTFAMRDAGKALLPQWENEEADTHAKRLAVSTLFPAYERTVNVMSGKPFSKQLTPADDMAEPIEALLDDVDREGHSLHTFASEVMEEAMAHGLCGLLVDYPTLTEDQTRSQAAERAAGARPYLVHIRHRQILGWREATTNGKTALTQLRLMEWREEADGEFGKRTRGWVRVIEPTQIRLFRQSDRDADLYEPSGEPIVNTLGKVFFVPIYGRRRGFMCGEPPLMNVAHLNVKHWQSQSDQDNLLHVARVPILVMIGGDEKTQLVVGASSAVKLPAGVDADLKFVEHEGRALEAGDKALARLEEQMVQAGAELLVQKPGGTERTATEASNDAEGNKCDLQRITETFEDSLDSALMLMGEWLKVTGETGHVSLFKDFGAAQLTDASEKMVLDLHNAGLLQRKTVLLESQRRGTISADIDVDDELAAAEAEGPSMTMQAELENQRLANAALGNPPAPEPEPAAK